MLTFSIAGFEVNLTEFVQAIRDLTSVKLDQNTKDELKILIAEARKSFDAVVDVMSPLYAITDDATLTRDFPSLYATFKNVHFKNIGQIRTHCHIVNESLERLQKGQSWKQWLPVAKSAFDRLVQAQRRWLGNDGDLADSMDRFLGEVDRELGVVAITGDPAQARRLLSDAIGGTEPKVLALKQKLDDLAVLSASL